MAIFNNNNKYKKMRYVVYDGKIVLGPQRKYKIKTLYAIAIIIMVVSFAMVAIIGAGLVVNDSLLQTTLMLLCLIAFIYGTQLTGVCRSSKEIINQRNKEIENAKEYARRGNNNGKK